MALIPVEVLLKILQEAVDTIPIRDLLTLRLVNTLFAHEIITLLLQSPRLENDGFGFAHPQSKRTQSRWYNFPERYKRQYLHRKVQQHPTTRCIFTDLIHEILALDHAPRTKEQEYILVDKLIDA